jgi:hypothetical protein
MSLTNQQNGIISGSVYDAELLSTSVKYLEGRMPRVGDSVEFDDGRKFRFVSSKTALTAAEPASMATASNSEVAGYAATVAGETAITPVTTATSWFGGTTGILAANRLAGGYVCINDDAGESYYYRIKSHNAGTAALNMTFQLYDPIKVATDTSTSDIMIIGPKYREVVAGAADLPPVGICMVACTGTSEYFFWVQTKGPGIALTTGATIGLQQVMGSAVIVDGAAADVGLVVVGVALGTSANGNVPVDLTIE